MNGLSLKQNAVLIVDGTNLMHRHFYSKPDLAASDGTPTGALYGTVKMLKSYAVQFKPLQIFICCDKRRKNFRNQIFPDYKANRKPTDERLKSQFALLRKFCFLARLPYIEADEYEADDLIGSLSTHAFEYGFTPYAVSGDRDIFQLIDKQVDVIYLSNKGPVLYDAKKLEETYGLKPWQYLDFKALQGDKGDNIPGIPGVGEKTAVKLLNDFKNLDGIYENIDQLKGKLKEKVAENKDIVYKAKELVTIRCDMDLDYNSYFEIDIEEGYDFDNAEVKQFLNRLDIKSL